MAHTNFGMKAELSDAVDEVLWGLVSAFLSSPCLGHHITGPACPSNLLVPSQYAVPSSFLFLLLVFFLPLLHLCVFVLPVLEAPFSASSHRKFLLFFQRESKQSPVRPLLALTSSQFSLLCAQASVMEHINSPGVILCVSLFP